MRNRRMMLGLAVIAGTVCGRFAQAAPTETAKYTIMVFKYEGAGRSTRARKELDEIKKATGLKDFWIINEELVTTVYYGKYKTVESLEDKDESDRAKRDLQKLADTPYMGGRPFRYAVFQPIPLPDPEANPAWDLKNATGVYSLQIGAFKDNPERKQAAVDAVKDARAQGLEAYYFHGPTTSSVLVGAFPVDALKEIGAEGEARPDQDLLMLPFIPKGMPDEMKGADGKTTKLMEHRVEVTDPGLAMLMKKFPEHAVNGVVSRMPNGQLTSSFIVDIREVKKESLLNAGSGASAGGATDEGAPAAGQLVPKKSTPGSGKLKSVGN